MRRRNPVPPLLLAALAALPLPAAAQDGGGGAPPPPPDLRFFPKDLEDALRDLQAPDADDEVRFDALQKVARMRGLDGAAQPLKDTAFAPVLAKSLETRQDTFADTAGTFLAALDPDRLAAEARKAADSEKDPARLRNLTFLAECLGAPRGVEILAGPLAQSPAKEVRARVLEALGLLRAEPGIAMASAHMKDADLEVRNVAALALGRIGDPRAVPALLAGLSDTKGYHGWFCADALGMLEDPGIFDAVLARGATGAAAGPRAKALEICARPANVEVLVGLVQRGASPEVRTAAANALGRVVGEDRAAAERLRPDLREAVADALLDGLAADKEPTTRAACCWALRRCATPQTGAKAFRRLLAVQGDDKLLYLLTILGEQKVKEAAPVLLRNGILGARQPMIRRAAGVAFWQIGDPDSVRQFREQILAAQDYNILQRLCEALGSWRAREGFETALQLLRTTREGSREQFEVMLALEKMTGHYFGPFPGVWNKWFERNPQFFTPKQARVEREKWREEFDRENKGWRHTKETEKAVQMGLAWLARHQAPDGIWDSTGFLSRCDPRSPCSRQGGGRTQFAQSGTTGLPSLCFTGAGYAPDAGRHRHTIRRGLESLVATVSVDGDFDQGDLLWNRSYSRPIAMQALVEGYGASGDERFRRAAERILAREFALMNERGGWRYSLQREVPELDSSVTAWVVFAMKAAEKAGVQVPRLLWEGPYLAFDNLSQRVPQAGPYEDLVDTDSSYGFEVGKEKDYVFITGYQDPSGGPGRATTPLGLMSRIFLGWRRSHPFCIGSANYISRTYLPEFDCFGEPGREDWTRAGRFAPQAIWPMYNIYYSTLSMHQMGGKYFYNWNRRVSRVLPYFQRKEGCERGAWTGQWGRDSGFGWLYTTSMGILTLETYYRYLPVLQE